MFTLGSTFDVIRVSKYTHTHTHKRNQQNWDVIQFEEKHFVTLECHIGVCS